MAIGEEIAVDVTGIGSVDALADALDKAAASAAKLRESMSGGGSKSGAASMARSMDAAATKMAGAVDKMDASFAKLKASGAEASAAMGDIGKAGAGSAAGLGDAAKGANDAAASYARLGKASRDSAAMMGEQAAAGSRAAKSSAAAASGGTKFWSGLKTVMIGTGIAAAYGIDKAMKFQSQMLLLHTQAGVSVKDTQAMSQGALKISTQTGQALGDVAESAYHVASNMASMGTSVPKMLEATKVAAEGASVGHANMVDVTNALTAAIASGIPGVKDYQQAMGALNATVGSGDMSMQDLSEAFGTGMVASVKGYGLSLKDVGAGLAVLGDNNIRGAKAGTDMRMAVQSLAVPAATAKKELAGLGLTTGSLAKDMQSGGLLKALTDLDTRFRAHGITAKNEGQVITDLFGKKAGVGLSILMEQMDRLKSKYPDITDGANNFSKAWAATQASPAQKWKETMAGLKASATGFGTELLPAFTKVTGFANKLLGDINGSKAGATAMAVSFGGIAALFAGKKLFSGVESAVGTLGKAAKFLDIPGLRNLGGAGGADAAAAANGRLAGSANAAAAALGRVAGAGDGAAVGEAAAGKGGAAGAAAGGSSKLGSALGAAMMTAAGAWLIGHGIGMLLPKATKAEQAAYRKNVPGWAQAPTDFVFGSKAASLYQALPSGADLWHDVFGGGGPQAKLAPHQWQSVVGPSAPATYPGGKPFYGEVPTGVAKPENRPAIPAGVAPAFAGRFGGTAQPVQPVIKPKVEPPDTGKFAGFTAAIASAMHLKPVKMPPPDLSAMDAAKGKAASAGSAIIQAFSAGVRKPVKAAPPDLSSYASAAGKARAAGANISSGLAAGILSGEGAVVAAASQVASAASAAMAHAVQSRSPSKVTQKIGADTAKGFEVGLQGGQAAINAAATALGKNAAKATDIASIDNTVAKMKADVKGDTGLVKWLSQQQSKLTGLANKRTKLEQEIADSQQIAQAAISGASIMNATSAQSPSANEPQSWQNMVTGMQNQADTQSQFTTAIGDLRKKGLNATELNQLVQGGAAAGLPIAQGIDAGGKQAISQLNAVQAKIRASSAKLGDEAAPVMYQAGKDATAGLAKGLKADLAQVDKDMQKIANTMVAAVQKHTGTAKAKTKAAAASTAAGAAAGSTAASGTSSGSPAAGGKGTPAHAAASLSAAGASLSGAASALTSAATALHKDATAGTVHAHPVASAARSGAHLVAAAAASGGGGGGTVHNITNVTVQGTVTAERDLLNSLQTLQLKRASNNHQGGWKLPGRGT